MKILLISLLRPGDFIMHLRLIRGAKVKYPNAEIHVLLQDISREFSNLLDDDVKVHYFRRTDIINSSRDSSYPLTTPLHLISDLIARLKDEKFDLTINLTHNQISALIAGQMQSPRSFGLAIRDGKVFGLESSIARRFNDEFPEASSYPFHYIESLASICELPAVDRARSRDLRPIRNVAFQFLSSDEKKDLPLDLARSLFDKINQKNLRAVVLAAPFEISKLSQVFDSDEMEVLSIDQLKNFLPTQDALVSVDTMQLHLASELGVPTLGIHLGSSSAIKTSARGEHSRNVVAGSHCYPCKHSQPCPYSVRHCAAIDLNYVINVFDQLKNEIDSSLKIQPNIEMETL